MVGLLIFALGVASAAGAVLYSDSKISRVEVEGIATPGDEDGDGEIDEGIEVSELSSARHVLLVGSDSREGLTREERNELRLGHEHDSNLTDTIMLLRIDPNDDHVQLLSFPRDLLLTRCDGSQGKINAAYQIGEERRPGGGPSCLVQTISEHTGIPIHHYMKINFAGFVQAVDTLGGVTMYLDEPLEDHRANLDLPAGCVTLTPADALAFVRARYLDSDFGRIARQQRFMREVAREVTSAGVLMNPAKVLSLVDTFSRTVETDYGLSLGRMRQIAFTLRDVDPDNLDTRTIPAVDRIINGGYYVIEREPEAPQLYAAFRAGQLFPDDVGTDASTEITPDDVPQLFILNGAGIPGLAGDAATLASERGFAVRGTENADTFDIGRTQIRHHPDREEEAKLVEHLFPDATLMEDPEVADDEIVVVVGSDFDAQRAEPTPEPSPSAPPVDENAPTYRGAESSRIRC
jgi:LCP family protein required for cell wall assembly